MKMEIETWINLVLLILVALCSAWWLSGCTTIKKSGEPLKSLCLMDYDSKMCWTNKSEKKGMTFDEMKKQHDACLKNPEVPCWYGVNSNDLKRLINK